MVTTTVRMLNRVHRHTSDNRPALPLGLELVVSTAGTGYGYAPNPKMPHTFMAVSLDTPYGKNVHSPYKAPAR